MSRYTITVTGNHRADSDAIIGYDPPLRTFFLQAFPDGAATISLCGSAPATANTKRSTPCTRLRLLRASTSHPFPMTSPRGSQPTSRRRPTGHRMTARFQLCRDICKRNSRRQEEARAG